MRYLSRCLYVGIVLLLMAAVRSYAQLPDFNVQLLDDKNGIQTANALRLTRDRAGFLWVLSPRHIQRFDGQSVKRIDTEGEDLLDIAADSTGTIWVVSNTGIRNYHNERHAFTKIGTDGPDFGPLNKLGKLQVTPDNQVWANAGRGLYRFDARAHNFRFQELPGLLNHYYYRKIFGKLGYRLYLADMRAIYAFDIKKNTVQRIPFANILALAPVNAHIVWVSNQSLETFEIDFSNGSVRRIPARSTAHPDGIPLSELISFNSLGGGRGLVNTTKGCYIYNEKDGKFSRALIFDSGKPLPNDENYADYADADGTQWILSQHGILFFRPLVHTIGWLNGIPGPQKNLSNNIRAIAEDGNGNIWLGTSGGISVLHIENGKISAVPSTAPAAPFSEVRGLVSDGRNLIVAPGRTLPLILDPAKQTFKHLKYPAGTAGLHLKEKLRNDVITMILKKTDGNFLMLGEGTAYTVTKGSYEISETLFPNADRLVQTAATDPRGNYWMGTYRGLVVVDPAFKKTVTDSTFSPGNLVSAVLLRNDSTAWCGSVGLYEVVRNGNALKKRLIFPELRNQRITILHGDKSGRVWIGGDDGLYVLNPGAQKLQWFDFRDNIQNKKFNYNSLLESSRGTIYIGGLNGLNYFDPDKLKHREERLNVIITSVRVNDDDSVLAGAPLQLDWKQNSVEIQFVTPYYRNPQKLLYRYRLTGLDNRWVDNGRSSRVRFPSLAPGAYAFTVAASLDGVTWWETSGPVAFTIRSPWWRAWWFTVLCVLCGGGIVYWIFKRRIAAVRRKTAMREHLAELEMRALRAQMNPHFIFNCLNSINRYIVKADNATASLYLTRFAKLIRLILDNSNSKSVMLSSELEALKLYIEMERIRFDNKFEFGIEIGEDVNPDSVQVPPLIIQPYVENAIWHGLLHKEGRGELWITVRMAEENVLECIVEDNGIGREKSAAFRSKSLTGRKSLGMKLTQDRIAVLNQQAGTTAGVAVLDLVDDTGEPAGTRVVITMPV